jgi:uncharacterized caspase-like protein
MRPAALFVVVTFGVLAVLQPAHAEKRVALVIGNSAYQHTRVLPNPKNDADAIAALLRTNSFDEVSLKTDLDYSGMREAARLFGQSAQDTDIAIVYYAGHGLEVAAENYLIPVDAKLASHVDLEYEAVTLASVLNVVGGARRLKLVILDACRNNPLGEKMVLRTGATRSVARGLARVEPRGEVLVAYSARAGTLARDGTGKHSPYAEALLKHIATPGLDVIRMFGRVKEAVLKTTNQVQEPWIYGSPGGDVIALVPAKQSPPVAPVPSGPTADVVAWDLVKHTKDPELLQRFIRQFPESSKRAEAEKRAATLAATPPPAPPPAAPPKAPSRTKSGAGNSKCFTFQSRQFCE